MCVYFYFLKVNFCFGNHSYLCSNDMVQFPTEIKNKIQHQLTMKTRGSLLNNPSKQSNSKLLKLEEQLTYELSCIYDQLLNNQSKSPSPRAYSQFVYHKNKLYIYGGFKLDHVQENSVAFYSYDLYTKIWLSHTPKASFRELQSFSPKCSGIQVGKWFLFGTQQKDEENNEKSQIWKLNFEIMDWIKLQQKGDIPVCLQNGCFLGYDKNLFIYFGGYDQKYGRCSNILYVYNIDSKVWHQCHGSYMKTIKSRFSASIVNINNRLFLYGGYYKQIQSLEILGDFYEITIRLPSRGVQAQAYFRPILTQISPSPRAEHQLFACESNNICLVGGKTNEQSFETNLWSFHIITEQWKLIDNLSQGLLKRQGSSIAQGESYIFIFGGIQTLQGQRERLRGDLWCYSMNFHRIYCTPEELQKIETCITANYKNSCKLCYEMKHGLLPTTTKFSTQVIEGAISLMGFPFPAFGLLIDNSVSLGADTINISIERDEENHCICISDNSKIFLSQEDMITYLAGFETPTCMIISGFNKNIKKQMMKEHHRKEYGKNLKLGSLALGKQFLLISNNKHKILLFYCCKEKVQTKQPDEENKAQQEKSTYTMYYYSVDATTKELTDPQMENSRQLIESKFKKQIKSAVTTKRLTNHLFIFETFLDSPLDNVTYMYQTNDLFYGDKKYIDKLLNYGYNLSDSIDVSLRAYLSLLYLKTDQLKMSLAVKHCGLSQVISQNYLQKIDKAGRSGLILDLEDVVDFEFKLFEAYWQRDARKNMRFFSNGVLLYSKNRLISRYKIELGELLPVMIRQVNAFQKYLPFFGYAELPDNIPVNIFKTNFSFSILMEKLFSRLKFVEEGLKLRETAIAEKYKPKNQKMQNVSEYWKSPKNRIRERMENNKKNEEQEGQKLTKDLLPSKGESKKSQLKKDEVPSSKGQQKKVQSKKNTKK